MEIKDVTAIPPVEGATQDTKLSKQGVISAEPVETDDVTLSSSANLKTIAANATRLRTNTAINALNVLEVTGDELTRVFRAVTGVLDQAEVAHPATAAKLETEGKELIDEVDKLIRRIGTDGVRPLMGEPMQEAIEDSLGKALDLLVPPGREYSGLERVELNSKQGILIARGVVAKAQAQFEDLRADIEKISSVVRAASKVADAAAMARNAGMIPIRQADMAVKVTSETQGAIADRPFEAMSSIGVTQRSKGDSLPF